MSALRRFAGWNEWFSFLDIQIPHSSVPSSDKLAGLLRRFLRCDDLKGAALLKKIRSHFAIERLMTNNPHGIVLPSQGWARIRQSDDQNEGPGIQIAVGRANYQRRWSVEAHEVGHLFYATLLERASSVRHDHRLRSEEVERFCWRFAADLLCSWEERAKWDYEYINGLLTEKTCQSIETQESNNKLTFEHIREIARRRSISIRMVVALLDRHPLLSQLETGIAILRNMPNASTMRDEDLRVFMRARPSWGYLVQNQRAVKQGFVAARSVFEQGDNQKGVNLIESLRLRYRSTTAGVRWIIREVETNCAYTPVDVVGEGRYLLVVWNWPSLEARQNAVGSF
jgi:hypothetical protein